MTRAAIAAIPDGAYEFEDYLDDDGVTDDPVPIRVRLTIRAGALHGDFTGSAPERPSSINAVAAVTRSAVYYVVRCLLERSYRRRLRPGKRRLLPPGHPHAPRALRRQRRPPARRRRRQRRDLPAHHRRRPRRPRQGPAGPHPRRQQGTMNNITIGGIVPSRLQPRTDPPAPGFRLLRDHRRRRRRLARSAMASTPSTLT